LTKTIGSKVTDELYSKVLTKCAGLSCTPSHYLKRLIETDLAQPESKKTEAPKSKKELEDQEFEKWLNTPIQSPKDDLDE